MADAQKILPNETLRDSFPKLNHAIDNANEALRQVSSIDDKVLKAVDKVEITPERTTFVNISKGKNLFDKKEVLFNTFYDSQNAFPVVTLNGYYTMLTAIQLKANTSFTITNCRQWFLFDEVGTRQDFGNTGNNSAVVTIKTPNIPTYLWISGSMSLLDTTQVEEGTQATSYAPFHEETTMPTLMFTEEQKRNLLESEEIAAVKVVKEGEIFQLIGKFGGSKDIVIKTTRTGSANGSFNFLGTDVNGINIHNNADDITPIRTFTTVGANHGYTTIIPITVQYHAKTMADLGSQWTDGVTTYTLLQINSDTLVFGCPYTESDGVVSSVRVAPVDDLTHVSGATNTDGIDITNVGTGQLYPSINNISVKYVLDGEEITEDGTYFGNELQVQESYNIMDYKSIINYAQENIGSSYVEGDIAGLVKISNIFTFTDGLKCTTAHGFKALKKVYVGNCGFLQSVALNLSGHNRKRFMPHVKAKEGFDFAQGIDLDEYTANLNFNAADLVDPLIPPSYYVDWLYDMEGNKKYGFSMGYIVDKTNSKNDSRISNAFTYWDMRSTKKSYPVAMGGVTLEEGEYRNFMGFRNYLPPEEVIGANLLNIVKDKQDKYIYISVDRKVLGFNKEVSESVGKDVTLLQSENITLLNETVDSEGVVFNSTGSGSGVIKI